MTSPDRQLQPHEPRAYEPPAHDPHAGHPGALPPEAPWPGSGSARQPVDAGPPGSALHGTGHASGPRGSRPGHRSDGTPVVLSPLDDVDAAPTAGATAAGAPVRTGSPIIAPGMRSAVLTAALGLLLAGGALVGRPGLAVVVAVLQAVTAAGWFRLNGMWPARQGIVLAFLAGLAADVALLVTERDNAPAVLIGTLGVWLPLVLVLQLRHRGSADERISSLTATSVSTFVTVLATGYLAAAGTAAGSDPVVIGATAVAVAILARVLPLPGAVSVVVALLAAAGSGFVTGQATGTGHVGALFGLGAGVCALIGHRVASYDFPSRFVHLTAGVALPLTAAAPVVYLLARR